MKKIGTILLSGGLDSTTVAAYAKTKNYDLAAITLHYGQSHSKEVQSASRVAQILGLKQEIVDVSFFKNLAWYSALTNPEKFTIPKNRNEEDLARIIPITYVPLRNTLFVTMAAAYLESEVLYLIERENLDPQDVEASIFIAANAIDYSGYPDCRPEYFEKIAAALCQGSKLGAQYERPIKIETPIIQMTKADIVRLGIRLGAPLEYTWSCYEGYNIPCGSCDSCLLRARGFAEAGEKDPLLERLAGSGVIATGKPPV